MHRRQYIKRLKERERSYAKTSRVEQRRTRQGKEESERERERETNRQRIKRCKV